MHHHRIRVRPERKNVPSAFATLDPRTPKQCKVGCQLSRSGDRFRGAKKSFHSCLRTVYRNRQHCKGGAGWSQPWSDSSKCRGDVFSLGTERDSTLTTPAYASERKIHVPWRHGPLTALSVSVKQATIRLMPKSVGIEHKAQDGASLLVSLSLCVCLLFAMAPHLSSAELDFVSGLAPLGKSPAEVHAALSRKHVRQELEAPTLKRLRGALREPPTGARARRRMNA